jgi:peptide/nickel transport system substrate-binding protein
MVKLSLGYSVLRAHVFAAGLLAASLPAATGAGAETVLRYAASAEPRTLDPVANGLAVTHEHAYLVYDNLFSLDENYRPQPQMVDTVQTSADGTTWTMTLRTDQRFHDGSPVTSADVIASVKRWASRDTTGRRLTALGLQMETLDARSFRMTLPRPTPLLLEGLAKPTGWALFIMRAADAETDPMKPVKEIIGSGPFRFVADEYKPGYKLVYTRNPDYHPRAEKPSYFAGGKVAKLDRVEWLVMPDSGTAIAALQNNEIDVYETPPMDLVPLLRKRGDIAVEVHGKQGAMGFLRFNLTQPPFDKPEARRALALLVDQADFMQVAAGNDPQYWHSCYSFMACGGGNEAKDTSAWVSKPDIAQAKALFRQGLVPPGRV